MNTFYLPLILPLAWSYHPVHEYVFGDYGRLVALGVGCLLIAFYGFMGFRFSAIHPAELVFYFAPIAQVVFGGFLCLGFKKVKGHSPRDVVFNFGSGYFWDRCYFMTLVLPSILIPFWIVDYFWGFPLNGT